MKRLLVFVVMLAFALSCQTQKTSCPIAEKDDSVVAQIGDEKITMGDLDKSIEDEMKMVKNEVYKIRKAGLDRLIDDKLIDLEAKASNVSKEDLLKTKVVETLTPVTDSELKEFFDKNVAARDPSKKFDDMKDRIKQYMEGNKYAEKMDGFVSELRKKHEVKISLEPSRASINIDGYPTMGSGDIMLVEFSDYQCPYCKVVRQTVWQLMDDYKGKLKYVFIDAPLVHPQAAKVHQAAHCAGDQGKYFEYNKAIFENQSKLDENSLKEYAKKLKLDTKKFDECLANNKHESKVKDGMNRARVAGVNGTPSFFVNGIMISGAQPIEEFKKVIESELNK